MKSPMPISRSSNRQSSIFCRFCRKTFLVLLLLLFVSACKNDLKGPTPSLEPEGDDPRMIAPSFTCNEQTDTWITLWGEGFSPLVVLTLDSNEDFLIEMPIVELALSRSIEGEESDNVFSVTLMADDVDTLSEIRWHSKEELEFRVHPELGLPPGIYNLRLATATGRSAEVENILGVLPRPIVTSVEPALLCLAQGGHELVVQGDFFLVDGSAFPLVDISGKVYTPNGASNCRNLGDPFGTKKVCQTLRIDIGSNDFNPGEHPVSILNPDPAACASIHEEDEVSLVVVPPPVAETIVEEIACTEEDSRSFIITGQGFLNIDGNLPSVEIGAHSYPADTVDNCEPLDVDGHVVFVCLTMAFTVPAVHLDSGVHEILVTNPQSAPCQTTDSLSLTITPRPSITDIEPIILCSEQIDNELIISGEDFYVFEGTTPSVYVGDQLFSSRAQECTRLDSLAHTDVDRCDMLVVSLPPNTFDAGEKVIGVTNPDPIGCSSTEIVNLEFVSPPMVLGAVENFACNESQSVQLFLEGEHFLSIDGVLPHVSIGSEEVTTLSVEDCSNVVSGFDIQTCTRLLLEIDEALLDAGNQAIIVTNPAPAACASAGDINLHLFSAPLIQSALPAFFCSSEEETEIVLLGERFLTVDQENPVVRIDGTDLSSTPSECSSLQGMSRAVQECTTLTVTLPAHQDVGSMDIQVINPAPLNCDTIAKEEIYIAGAPHVLFTDPAAICADATFDGVITLHGDSFLEIDGDIPGVSVWALGGDPADALPAEVTALDDCRVFDHNGSSIKACSQLILTMPEALRPFDVSLEIVNPSDTICPGATVFDVLHEPTPIITSVTPLRVCVDGGVLLVEGENFEDGMIARLGWRAADTVVVAPDGRSAEVTFVGPLTTGPEDLIVTNPNNCTGVYEDEEIRVVSGPTAVYVDPPVVFDGVSTQVTIYLSGLWGGSVNEVEIIDSTGDLSSLDFTADPDRQNTVQAIVPAGILDGEASGIFGFAITDDLGCTGSAADILTVTGELGVSIHSIDPPFGWTQSSTGVTVTSDSEADPSEHFQATPRVYLNPTNAGPGDVATELRSTQFISSLELGGIVRSGMPVGHYDIIVINPDSGVGLLEEGFYVAEDPPPLIDTVSPGSWRTNRVETVLIEGSNFRSPTAYADCMDSGGALIEGITIEIDDNESSDTLLTATIDTNAISHLSVCAIRVSNDDDTYGEYSPITVTNPAGNFVSFSKSTDMLEERRAAAGVSGAPSRRARYVYALGGDEGTADTAKASTEAARLDRFGQPGEWFYLPYDLPEARTLADAVRVDDFIYLVGGHNGTDAVDTVLRSHVLAPLDVPRITNMELQFSWDELYFNDYLDPGVYYYRVSAVLDSNDPANPGGETLASETQAVRVPLNNMDLTIVWSEYPNAIAYRIYRTSGPDEPAGDVYLLAEVDGDTRSFTDRGTETADPDTSPLPLGSLGVWHDVATLGSARHSLGVASALDPNDADISYIYAVAGHDGAGALASYEFISVTKHGPKNQSVSPASIVGPNNVDTARHQTQAMSLSPSNASILDDHYIMLLGGRTAPGQTTAASDVATVLAGGELSDWRSPGTMQHATSGFSAAVANNVVAVLGGSTGATIDKASKIELGCGLNCPTFAQSSSLSNVNMDNRNMFGAITFGGMFYLLGGSNTTDGNNATRSTEFSILGGTP